MIINQIFPIHYMAKNYETGLLNINLLVKRPDSSIEGLFLMNEFDNINHRGIYLHEYIPNIEGYFLFTVFQNGIWKFSKTEFCEVIKLPEPSVKFN